MRMLPLLIAFLAAGCRVADERNLMDAGAVIVDAGLPAGKAPLPSSEVTSGAGRVTGSRFAADVQIGHSLNQGPAAGASKAAEGNAAVKP